MEVIEMLRAVRKQLGDKCGVVEMPCGMQGNGGVHIRTSGRGAFVDDSLSPCSGPRGA